MASAKEYRNRADEARNQAQRSVQFSEKATLLRIAEEWMKLAQPRAQPIDGVIGSPSRVRDQKAFQRYLEAAENLGSHQTSVGRL